MLTELSETEVDNLCSILYKEWPQTIPAIGFLKTCTEWRRKKPSLDIQILYHEKNIQSGIFMLIHKSGCNVPILTMYALDSYENELEDIFSNFLDKCDKSMDLSLISEKHIPIVKKVIDAKGCTIIQSINFVISSLDMNKAKDFEISYPSDVEVKLLEKDQSKDIYETLNSQIKHVYSLEEFENRLVLNNEFAVGIFCKKTGLLLSRCLRSHNGSICALGTIEEARGKGYAKLVLKLVSKKLADLSITPYLITNIHNELGMKAAFGVGFNNVGNVTNVLIEKSKAPIQY